MLKNEQYIYRYLVDTLIDETYNIYLISTKIDGNIF